MLEFTQIQIFATDVFTFSSTLGDQYLDGLDHDDEVFHDAVIFNIHQIIDEFIVRRRVVFGKYLSQAGNTRFNIVAIGIFGVLFL